MKKIKFSSLAITTFLLMLGLCVFGCIMVYSASSYSANKNYGNQYYFLYKQIIGVILGLAGCIFFSFFDYKKLKKLKWVAFIISCVCLVLVFIPGIGIENYGARRWIGFGGFSFQPSELAKFSLVLFCACHLSDNKDNVKSFKTILPVLFVGLTFCGLVILEPNMSVTMCLGLVMIAMLFVGGISKKHFFILGVPAICAVPALIIAEPYRMKRLLAFINPWASPQGEGFQLIQSLYALGNGGLFGVGLFNSRQKYLFLPFSESDFIFSIIGEELGLFGSILLILVFIALVVCIILIGAKSDNRFACLLCTGIALIISIQVLINIAVVTGVNIC